MTARPELRDVGVPDDVPTLPTARWHKVVSLYQFYSHLAPGDPDYDRLRQAETEGCVLHVLLAEGWVIESVTSVTGGPAFAHMIKDVPGQVLSPATMSLADYKSAQPAQAEVKPTEPTHAGPALMDASGLPARDGNRSPLGLRQLREP